LSYELTTLQISSGSYRMTGFFIHRKKGRKREREKERKGRKEGRKGGKEGLSLGEMIWSTHSLKLLFPRSLIRMQNISAIFKHHPKGWKEDTWLIKLPPLFLFHGLRSNISVLILHLKQLSSLICEVGSCNWIAAISFFVLFLIKFFSWWWPSV